MNFLHILLKCHQRKLISSCLNRQYYFERPPISQNIEYKVGDIVPYHNRKVSPVVEKAFKDLGDQCVSTIWKSLIPHFGIQINNYFDKQATNTRYMCIDHEENPTNVMQMHISKNSFIKLHIDMNDLESSIITWFSEGHPEGAEMGLFQMLYKFKTNFNGSGLFFRSEEYVHGTLEIDTKGNDLENYTLGVALTNKKGLITRETNQLSANTKHPRGIPSSRHWYTIDPRHLVE